MAGKIKPFNAPIPCRPSITKPAFILGTVAFSSPTPNPEQSITTTTLSNSRIRIVNFKTLGGCKLGISRYPDFDYNAEGGKGTGTVINADNDMDDEISVSFDLRSLYIPSLTGATTKFLGLPLPPLLKIDIVPELFDGRIRVNTGQVDLEFTANFWFSVGSVYRAPPLLVKTVLTSEESSGKIRSGKGERLDKEGNCRLVGVATVDPIDDTFMNAFLALPTECLAVLNANISFSLSS